MCLETRVYSCVKTARVCIVHINFAGCEIILLPSVTSCTTDLIRTYVYTFSTVFNLRTYVVSYTELETFSNEDLR